ncbi:MAG TPA: tRNA pseudouridine(55) synthase TruB [Spirochaetales bacterium]|nr:tRNA pseudouridine(55) synthase TruB [Spirochaetales bacterium]
MSGWNGVVLLHKPRGITSFDALHAVKKVFKTKRVGHAGTLDRFASGLLLVLMGSYTRLFDLWMDMDKEYEGIFEFGKETDTLDPEGIVLAESSPPSLEEIQTHIPSFLGTINQAPPAFSAVHVQGKRAYQQVRRGISVQPPPRRVTIHSIEVLEYHSPLLKIRVRCGKGTYIRSLARDLGRICGSSAYVKELIRTRIGPFLLKDAVTPLSLNGPGDIQRGKELLTYLFPSRVLTVPLTVIPRVRRGQSLDPKIWEGTVFQEGPYILLTEEEELLGCLEVREGTLSYRFVVSTESV